MQTAEDGLRGCKLACGQPVTMSLRFVGDSTTQRISRAQVSVGLALVGDGLAGFGGTHDVRFDHVLVRAGDWIPSSQIEERAISGSNRQNHARGVFARHNLGDAVTSPRGSSLPIVKRANCRAKLCLHAAAIFRHMLAR